MSAVLLVAANDRFGLVAFHLQHSRLLLEISLTYARRHHVFNVIEINFQLVTSSVICRLVISVCHSNREQTANHGFLYSWWSRKKAVFVFYCRKMYLLFYGVSTIFEQEEHPYIYLAGPSSRNEWKEASYNSSSSGWKVNCLLAPFTFLVKWQGLRADFFEIVFVRLVAY